MWKQIDDAPGLRKAKRALALPRRRPTDGDRPRLSTFPGPKPKLLPGQLDFDGTEVPGVKEASEP